jgi:methylated-DNA-[protein]-cysteine S-methyltransferase
MFEEQWEMLASDHGTIAVVARGDCVCRVCFAASPDAAAAAVIRFCPGARQESSSRTSQALRQLDEYFHGDRQYFDLPLDYRGVSGFSRRVLQTLAEVPYGTVLSYGELAAKAGSPKAARAVGRVMAANPFPLVVPCHRVVNADGSPGNYSAAYGPASKVRLIDFERDHL